MRPPGDPEDLGGSSFESDYKGIVGTPGWSQRVQPGPWTPFFSGPALPTLMNVYFPLKMIFVKSHLEDCTLACFIVIDCVLKIAFINT